MSLGCKLFAGRLDGVSIKWDIGLVAGLAVSGTRGRAVMLLCRLFLRSSGVILIPFCAELLDGSCELVLPGRGDVMSKSRIGWNIFIFIIDRKYVSDVKKSR